MSKLWDGEGGQDAFIQWKGTNVCMDLHCPKCQHHNHYDTDFAYHVQCAKCKTIFEMSSFVRFREEKNPSEHDKEYAKQSNNPYPEEF